MFGGRKPVVQMPADGPVTSSGGDLSYGGFWARFAAAIIDNAILTIAAVGLLAVASLVDEGLATVATAIYFIGALLYWPIMESSARQATFGKQLLGLQVTDAAGARLSFVRALLRNIAKIISAIPLYIGFLLAAFTSRKQALHDIVAGCLVVNRGATGEQMQQGVAATGMPAWAIALIILAAMVLPVGILAAIALPAYQDYTVRARMATAMLVGQQATQAVETFYARNNTLPRDLKEAGMADPASREVRQVNVNPGNGAVQVVLAMAPLDGKSILFVPQRDSSNRVIWTCRSDDVQPRYLPPSCRQNQN
jgi:uncharacterized RDD family membrane protein YckC/Tfp pilus assembly major pilin PilA